jgi:hypothetical protein
VKPHAKAAASGSIARVGVPARIFGACAARGAYGEARRTGAWSLFRRIAARASWVGLLAVFALPLAPALASGPPQFIQELQEESIHATRARIDVRVVQGGEPLKWHAEYATSENGPWTAAGGGEFEGGSEAVQEIAIGAMNTQRARVLQHLAPEETYYARFVAEDADGTVTKTVKFTTTAESKPEIFEEDSGGGRGLSVSVHPGTPTSQCFFAPLQTNGVETEYHFEYSTSETGPWIPFASGASGVVSVAEDFASPGPEACATGLTPETRYHARVRARNAKGEMEEVQSFTTPTARPVVIAPDIRNVTDTSVRIGGAGLEPHGSETHWRLEYSTSATGPWVPVAGAEGTVSQAEAEALPEDANAPGIEGGLTGLKPATVYYVRLFAENKFGEGHNGYGEPIATETRGLTSFGTSGPPTASTFAVHGLHGEALRIMGSVNPSSVPTSEEQTITIEGAPKEGTFTLTFNGQTTTPIAFNAPGEGESGVEHALQALSSTSGDVSVTGRAGGPYRVFFFGAMGEVNQPQITANASGLKPSGAVTVATVQEGGVGYDTHYHAEYVSQRQFEEPGGTGGFAKALATPEVDLGSGDSTEYVGADLPGLQPGETYRFRIVATNTSQGDPVVYGEEQSLTVPVPSAVAPEEPESCPNAILRSGLSAQLPDCRAYELLTPVDKEGTQEIFNYGGGAQTEIAIGEDAGHEGADHFEYASPLVKWDPAPGAGLSPYVFSRTAAGWQTTGATAQPEGGIFSYGAQLFSPDLTQLALEANWHTSGSSAAPEVAFKAGPTGGPYTTVASVPSAQAKPGWVAASGDFSKLVLQVADHALLGRSTHTAQGDDLYEYSEGQLHQVNVTGAGPGATIGVCGATIAHYEVSSGRSNGETPSSLNAVSEGGSRVFFEAVPQSDGCGEAKHLYMRVDGAETIDLGAYSFLAADPQGSKVLMEKSGGEDPGLYLFNGSGPAKFLASSGIAVGANVVVSEDLSAVYVLTENNDLYRYGVLGETLGFVTHFSETGLPHGYSASPNGRYFYFDAEGVAGLPGGGPLLDTPHAAETTGVATQVYRYDSAQALLQCMSCASPYDSQPRLSAQLAAGGKTSASANGDYVFFDTPAALVASDVDGEVAAEGFKSEGAEHGAGGASVGVSVSSDVYEWRRDGLDGCTHVQGCLALITSGRGGLLNILLGASRSGRDVFFATDESLLPRDDDTAEDIYDARIDGGFAEPARAVECEGDACSTPFAAPSDLTPSSTTFQGAGDVLAAPEPGAKAKPKKKTRPKRKTRRRGKGKRADAKRVKRSGEKRRVK